MQTTTANTDIPEASPSPICSAGISHSSGSSGVNGHVSEGLDPAIEPQSGITEQSGRSCRREQYHGTCRSGFVESRHRGGRFTIEQCHRRVDQPRVAGQRSLNGFNRARADFHKSSFPGCRPRNRFSRHQDRDRIGPATERTVHGRQMWYASDIAAKRRWIVHRSRRVDRTGSLDRIQMAQATRLGLLWLSWWHLNFHYFLTNYRFY